MADIEATIRAKLEEFWDDRAIASGPAGQTTVDELLAPVESGTAVEVLVELDAITGLKLPASLIRTGGYDSKHQFVEHLTDKVMQRVRQAA